MIDKILKNKPKIFGEFEGNKIPHQAAGLSNDHADFVLFEAKCKCGSGNFKVHTGTIEEKKGFFKKKISKEFVAPAYLECSECGVEAKVFDPEVHGWDGENGDNASIVADNKEEYPGSPGRIYIELSYQNPENYEDLESEGVLNLQDYFDTFNLYIKCDQSDSIREIMGYECA